MKIASPDRREWINQYCPCVLRWEWLKFAEVAEISFNLQVFSSKSTPSQNKRNIWIQLAVFVAKYARLNFKWVARPQRKNTRKFVAKSSFFFQACVCMEHKIWFYFHLVEKKRKEPLNSCKVVGSSDQLDENLPTESRVGSNVVFVTRPNLHLQYAHFNVLFATVFLKQTLHKPCPNGRIILVSGYSFRHIGHTSFPSSLSVGGCCSGGAVGGGCCSEGAVGGSCCSGGDVGGVCCS